MTSLLLCSLLFSFFLGADGDPNRTIKSTEIPPIDVISPIDVTSINAEKLVKDLLSRWASEIKRGERREAERTLALLVSSTSNPRKNLPVVAGFLCSSKIEVGVEVVRRTKSCTNAGVSRHARQRGTVIEILENGDVVVEYQDKLPAYDIVDNTGHRFEKVLVDDVKGTTRSKRTRPGGNRKTHLFKCKKYAKPFCTYNFLPTANGPKWLGSGKTNKVYNRLQATVFRESQKQRLARGENKFRDITNQLQRARESKQYLNEELHKRDNAIVDKENAIANYKKEILKLKRKSKLNQAKIDEDAQVIINIRLCACLLHTLIPNLTSLLSYLIQR